MASFSFGNNFTATISGNVTGDPEVRQAGKTQLVTFTVAVNQYDFSKKEQKATFVSVSVFGEKAIELISNHVKKGSQVLAVGTLNVSEWSAKGKSGVNVNLTADNVTLFGRKDENNGSSNSTRQSQPRREEAPAEDTMDTPF